MVLTNVFPVTRAELSESDEVGELVINITGDTLYNEGIEYVVSLSDVNNTVNMSYIFGGCYLLNKIVISKEFKNTLATRDFEKMREEIFVLSD